MSEAAVVTDPVQDLVDATGQWAAERLDARAIDHAATIGPALLEEIAEMGLFGLPIATRYGGLGLDLAGCCAVVAEIARHDRAVATTIGLQAGLGTHGLIRYGTEAQRARLLPELAAGKRIAAFAATEPGAGSDLSAISTRVTATEAGLRVHGAKAYVTNGGFASLFTVLCESPGLGGVARGQSLVLIERADPGVTIGPEEHKLGLRGSSTTPVYFEDVPMPADRVLGPPGKGTELAHQVLAWGRTAMAAGSLGTANAALDLVRVQVTERRQFGKPLAAQEVVQHQVAQALATVATMQALVDFTTGAPDDAALGRRSMATKILCSEGSWDVIDVAVQLHGGLGFIEESGMPLLLRDARITRIFEGANDVLAWRLGALAAMAPAEGPGQADNAVTRQAEALIRRVEAHRAELVATAGVKLFRRPVALHGLGRLIALAEAARAVADAPRLPDDLATCALDRLEALAVPFFGGPRDASRAIATRWLAQEAP